MAAVPDENYEIPETAQLDELETFVGQKKPNLAVDGSQYKTSGHPQVRGSSAVAFDLHAVMAKGRGLGLFSVEHRWLQSVPLCD